MNWRFTGSRREKKKTCEKGFGKDMEVYER